MKEIRDCNEINMSSKYVSIFFCRSHLYTVIWGISVVVLQYFKTVIEIAKFVLIIFE